MKDIKVLGSGCKKCVKTAELIESLAHQKGVDITVTKVTDPEVIMQYGVMSTPAVVVGESVVHSGSIPTSKDVLTWLSSEYLR